MTDQTLEQTLNEIFVPNFAQDRMYETIDLYNVGTTVLYTPPPKPFNLGQIPNIPSSPIGSQGSGFQSGSQNNIRLNLIQGLQERYDLSEHDNTKPHINYDLSGASKKFIKETLKDNHHIDLGYLFKEDK